jgi:hypothetical protein
LFEKLKAGFKHAFAVEPPGYQYTEEETLIADKVAEFLVKRGLTTPAVLFIKSSAPLNMIANQLLVFVKPFATYIFKPGEYKKFTGILEHRNSMDFLVERIEEAQRRLKAPKKQTDEERLEQEIGQGT